LIAKAPLALTILALSSLAGRSFSEIIKGCLGKEIASWLMAQAPRT